MAIDTPRLTLNRKGDVLQVQVPQAVVFEEDLCAEFRELVGSLLRTTKFNKMIVDMSQVQEIGSRFLGVLILLRKQSESRQGGLVVAGMQQYVAISFKVAGLTKSFNTAETVNEALQHFQTPATS